MKIKRNVQINNALIILNPIYIILEILIVNVGFHFVLNARKNLIALLYVI